MLNCAQNIRFAHASGVSFAHLRGEIFARHFHGLLGAISCAAVGHSSLPQLLNVVCHQAIVTQPGVQGQLAKTLAILPSGVQSYW